MKKRLIPQNCPECDYKFTFQDKSNHRMQNKARLIFALAIAILPFWWAAIYYFYQSMGIVFEVNLVVVAIAGAPGLFVASFAYNMPRVLLLKCQKCSFADSITLKAPKKTTAKNLLDDYKP